MSTPTARAAEGSDITDESVRDGDLQPHAVPDLEARLRGGHGFDDGGHVAVDGQVKVVQACGSEEETEVEMRGVAGGDQ